MTVNLDRRKRKTRQAVQKALMELMGEKSIQDITVTELAQRADINRKTFYNHYESVEEVKKELEQYYIDNLFGLLSDVVEIDVVIEQGGEIMDRHLRHFLHTLIERLNADPVRAKLIFTSGESLYLVEQLKHYLEPYIRQALKTIDVDVDVNRINFFMEYIVYGTFSTLNAWVQGVYPILPEDLEDLLYRMIQSNLSVPTFIHPSGLLYKENRLS